MDPHIFQDKYRIDMGTTYIYGKQNVPAPLHYHFDSGYGYEIIRNDTSDDALFDMARTIVFLNGDESDRMDDVLDDLRMLRKNLCNPLKVYRF